VRKGGSSVVCMLVAALAFLALAANSARAEADAPGLGELVRQE
jgi:hypothetical protein